jgi:hypothetical protein
MLVPCLLLARRAFGQFDVWSAVLGGVLGAACLLIYARLLGRVAWYTTLRKPKRV